MASIIKLINPQPFQYTPAVLMELVTYYSWGNSTKELYSIQLDNAI